MKVIAEGVENSEQVKILKSYDCDQIQGYYFSKPVPAEEFEKLMEKELYESVAEDADF
jgi:EAL domain-containing protein (putative c-di-GMP-specific phosphodiesterase class I)